MKKISLIICIFLSQQIIAQSYQKIHDKAIVVDTHNDILMKSTENGLVFDQDLKGKTHSDLARWKQGGLDVQLFSVFCDGDKKNPYAYANRQMDTLDAVAKRNPDKIVKVANTKELYKVVKQHKIAAMFGVEGGHMIENDLDNIDVFYKRGARYMTLTWNNSTTWATSAFDETFKKDLQHKGLTDFGKQVVQRMNELGMIVDVSHVGEQTFWDVINTTTKPIIASHSCVYNLCAHQRNLKDDQIKAIAKNGGVIQVNFYSGFLDSNFMKNKEAFIQRHKTERDSMMKSGKEDFFADEYLFAKYTDEVNALRAPLSLLIQHIEYIIKLVGVDYVGLGSDFDGIESPPQELDDVTTYPLITKALVEKGYSKKDITKILGGNFLRVLKANEK
ncbi:membrane dipeptidase [mine drainage metagenome]|uniref:Membrane dipeptidase n=1 Tax=mine drainage metagenome TaxID=410659 RepID=A0A1J5TGB0_9ZZZZ